ncbi:MAG: VPLPA-CTERM sorting domain-containing protein [Gammaproteobacteria bacterium]
MKLKYALTLTAGMLAGGQSQAALFNVDNALGFPGTGNQDVGSSMFFSIVNLEDNVSAIVNLGTTHQAFLNNPQALSFSDDRLTAFVNAAADKSQLLWNVGSFNNGQDLNRRGFLSTGRNGVPCCNTVPSFYGADGEDQTYNAYSGAGRYMDLWNISGRVTNDNYAEATALDPFYHRTTNWGPQWGGVIGPLTEGDLNASMEFWFLHVDPDNFFDTSIVEQQTLGQWRLTQLALGGPVALNFQPIPVPAAVWLLGSALLGMATIARRRVA